MNKEIDKFVIQVLSRRGYNGKTCYDNGLFITGVSSTDTDRSLGYR